MNPNWNFRGGGARGAENQNQKPAEMSWFDPAREGWDGVCID